MLAPVTEAHYGEERLLRLNLASARLYPSFVAALEDCSGESTGYRASGTMTVARDRDEAEALDELLRFQLSLGLSVERLGSREARSLEPGLAPGIRGAILVSSDHQIDNRALVGALEVACRRRRVELVEERVLEVVAGDAVEGVRTTTRAIRSPRVVVAAGCWSGSIAGLPPEVVPPVRPVKGQLLQLRGSPDLSLITRNVRGSDVYLVARADGRVVVGATVEERGFDSTVTAGALFELMRAASELVPGVLELELTETVAGLRPGSPDNAPLLGPTSCEGLIMATGHYRNGILLAPVTAQAIAAYLTDGRMPELAAPFTPERFERESVA